jgi:hypothetical protein
VKTVFSLLLLVAAISTPMSAEESEAPASRWQSASVNDGSTVNWARVSEDAVELAQAATPPAPPTLSTSPSSAQTGIPSDPPQPSAIQQSEPSGSDKSQREKAQEQLKEEEKQRVMGVVPSFNVTYHNDAVSLSAKQKMDLAFHTTFDWATIAGAFGIAGYHEVANDLSGFSWGPKGYFERAGAAYLDTFNGTMIGNGILPAVLHQDPRYFRMGHGRVSHRMLYAVSAAFICKHDNTGKWEPNYSNVLGNIASGAISNLYYPGSNSGIGLTISNGMIQTAEGAIGAIFQEFWPDISRRYFHKDPTHGLDAQYEATHGQGAGQPQPSTGEKQ